MGRSAAMKEIVNELRNINKNLNEILKTLKIPQKTKTEKIFDITCAGVGILGIITIADIIINWITGG
jgi:preprotein translocase subunit Sss1